MEMMTMMMELDKLPDPFSLPFQDLSHEPQVMEFSGGSTSTNHHHPPPQLPPIYRSTPLPTTQPPQLQFRGSRDYPRASWLQQKPDSVEAMREMIFRMAALQPVQIDPESVKPPKRRNVKISKDPQSVAARHRRERISERIRILQRLVPGGTKMDTASMLDEAVHYMKFLKKQVQSLEQAAAAGGGGSMTATAAGGIGVNVVGCCPTTSTSTTMTMTMSHHHGGNGNGNGNNYSNLVRACGQPAAANGSHMVGSMELLR